MGSPNNVIVSIEDWILGVEPKVHPDLSAEESTGILLEFVERFKHCLRALALRPIKDQLGGWLRAEFPDDRVSPETKCLLLVSEHRFFGSASKNGYCLFLTRNGKFGLWNQKKIGTIYLINEEDLQSFFEEVSDRSMLLRDIVHRLLRDLREVVERREGELTQLKQLLEWGETVNVRVL
ncbi:MAG: hypothetical protein KJI69_01840 [Patescibacteria group bacterium]|nr:hypothetical protein [Patescibacteria group bacterium]